MLATANTGKNWERFWKNAGEWAGRVEISGEEIPGSKWSMYGYNTDLLQALKGDRLSSVFSPDGTLISASAAPHCGVYRASYPGFSAYLQCNRLFGPIILGAVPAG